MSNRRRKVVGSSAVHQSRRCQEGSSMGCHKDRRRENHRLAEPSVTWGKIVAELNHEQVTDIWQRGQLV